MDRHHISSPSQKHIHTTALSPPPYRIYDGDEDTPSREEKPSGRRHHDAESTDRSSAKKPRHRHSPAQLAALNELFDKNEHPSPEDRTELAERLGMETKTVSAWFQNKRASTKKRNKTSPPAQTESLEKPAQKPPSALPSIANLLNATPQHSHPVRKSRQKDLHLNDHILADPIANVSRGQHSSQEPALESSFFAGPSEFAGQERFISSHPRGRHPQLGAVPRLHNSDPVRTLPDTDSRFVSENDALPSRRGRNDVARMRTTPEQADELRRAYALDDHPSRDQRQQLADRIGMRFQSVTNWFQNQRSQAKKHREESSSVPELAARHPAGRAEGLPTSRPSLPPRSHHPSLAIPERDARPPLSTGVDDYREVSFPRSRMSLSPSLTSRLVSPRMRRGAPPYARDSRDLDEGRHYDHSSENTRVDEPPPRPRRSRPEPHQLNALKKLLHRTLTPSIEERSALASEVGMDIGKVTNWFRNIRQSARKRGKRTRVSARRANHEHDASSGSSVYDDDDAMDLVYEDIVDQEMDDRSEEEYQEAVTPFTDVSSSPPPNKRSRSHLPVDDGTGPMDVGVVEPPTFTDLGKVVEMTPVGGSGDYDFEMKGVTCSGVKIEDALLLLSFHQHVVQ